MTNEESAEIQKEIAQKAEIGVATIYTNLVNSLTEEQANGIVHFLRSGTPEEKEQLADFLVEHFSNPNMI